MSIRGRGPGGRPLSRTRVVATASLLGGLVSVGLLSAGAASASTVVPCTGPGGGPAGLVAAINAANAHGGGTIDLAASCTYTVTTRDNSTDNGNGLPLIRTPITINGNHSTIARNSAMSTAHFRLFEVSARGTLSLDRLTITGGNTTAFMFPGGGAIFDSGGTVRLTNSRLTQNTSSEGAGLLDDKGGSATVVNSQIDHNKALIPDASSQVVGGGGVEVVSSSFTLTGSSVTDNFATNFGGGIETEDIVGGHGVHLSSSTVSNNRSDGNDGGIGDFKGGLVLDGTVVSNNSAFDDGGIGLSFFATATIRSSEVTGNKALAPEGLARAAGIATLGGQTTLIGTRVHDNVSSGQAADSGGIYNSGAMTLVSSPVFHNTAKASVDTAEGGGIFNDNQPSVNPSGVLTLTNSPVTDNTASGTTSLGGGIFNKHQVTLNNSPVVGNHPNNCRPAGSVPGCAG